MHFSFITLAVLSMSVANVAAATLTMPPPMPKAFPPDDESQPIPASYLTDPLVTEALAYVESVVPAQYLQIPPSTFKSICTATYNADATANCYWPANLCTRDTNTNAFTADVYQCPGQNTWGLTYDDGPIVNVVNGQHVNDTVALRNALVNLNDQKATFFVVGSMGSSVPDEIKATFDAGHHIATHTWTHWTSTSLTNAQFVAEMKYTEALIYKTTGQVPRFWRPPCGDIDDRIRAIASALGYRTVLWGTAPDRDSTDADVTPSSAAHQTVLKKIKSWFVPQAGFISLEHDISTFTVGVALAALSAIKDMGSSFPLKITDVGTCLNEPWYRDVSGSTSVPIPPASSVVLPPSSTPTSAAVNTASAPSAAPSASSTVSASPTGVTSTNTSSITLSTTSSAASPTRQSESTSGSYPSVDVFGSISWLWTVIAGAVIAVFV
ncbi:hypothetical protein SpCBS45565_g05946 [Spizellomyces sp. 'palustris']|nr:hypothetical protein SpCBS45565_g05946 [Spizellomyces sp. 'palustris']